MKKNSILFIFLLFSFQNLLAQNGLPMSAGARGAAMGDAAIGNQDIYSLFSNQAGLAAIDQISFAAVGESRFVDFGIRSVGAGVAIPSNAGTFGMAFQYFGIEELNEQKVGLAYGRKLFDKFSIGLQLDYVRLAIQDYGSRDLFTFELGLQSQVTKSLVIGFYTYSPAQIEIIAGENLPSIFRLGGALKVSPKLTIAAELEKDIDFPLAVHLGLEYEIVEALKLRFGGQTEPSELSFGLGYQLPEKLHIDVAATYHQYLGVTPTFSVGYFLQKKK